MKIRRSIIFRLSIFLLSLVLVINPVNIGGFHREKVNAQSLGHPYVVFVNGYENGRAWGRYTNGSVDPLMDIVVNSLPSNSEIRYVPWDSFVDGANQRSHTSNDAEFLRQATEFINQLDPNRPLILIGHSFGGDSLLSLASRISRRIQFLGVIDPTAAGGFREPVTRRRVPPNVDYFFNRWQQNALASTNVVPFDSRVVNGAISDCFARSCNDQSEQNLARRQDGSEIRISCEAQQVDCEGWRLPGCNFSGCWRGSNGTKAKRLTHNDMPLDEYLQRQMADRIERVLANFRPPAATELSEPKSIARFWPGIFTENIDAAVEKGGIVYFFKGSEYTAWDVARGQAEPGGPKSIARFWPGIFTENIDAAVEKGGIVYFFKGSEYTAWDIARGQAEPGGPKSIARFWPGIFTENIDAAVEKGGIVYFFKGSEYTAWDIARGQAEPGGPKSIARFWPGIFTENIDAAVEKGGIVYFFKGSEYTEWRE